MGLRHTPGPWDLYSDHPTEQWVDHVEDDEDRCFNIFRIIPGEQISDEEAVANAHLIAAAPRLLEALERARQYIALSEDSEEKNQLLQEIEAAIAEATSIEGRHEKQGGIRENPRGRELPGA